MLSETGYLSNDTIAALATATGGAIAVIRVSGPQAFSSLEALTRSQTSGQIEPQKLKRAWLYSRDGEKLDDALFVRFVNPQSYTGEDVVEYHVHGGGFTSHRILQELGQIGIRQALPGEFSFRGVRNGKMTLFQAQAVADLIAASNSGAVSVALDKISGSQNHLFEELGRGLRKMAVLGEVGIDFADQDIEEVSLSRLQLNLEPWIESLSKLYQSFDRGFRLQEGVKVAFVGLPNAGKSSFFNALLGEERSIVSEIAGTTRDVVTERITLRGKNATVTLRLEDTAGLRPTEDRVEKMGIDRTLQSAQNAELILFLVDPASDLKKVQEQFELLKNFKKSPGKILGIWTKCDQLTAEQSDRLSSLLSDLDVFSWTQTSSINHQGVSEAIDQVVLACEGWTQRTQGEVLLTRIDHANAVRDALEHLKRAQTAPEIDLFASDVAQSLHSLGPIIGQTLPDDILGQIFSDFCIGK